jgi:uncharacterized damage-inducible protein DinB
MQPNAIVAVLDTIQDYFNRSTRVLTEEHSSFAPKPEMFTVAAQVAHAAQTIDWFFDGVFGGSGFSLDFAKHDAEVRACTSLAAAREWFNAAIARAKAATLAHGAEEWAQLLPPGPIMGGEPRFFVIGAINDHTAHHRGALTVYSRLLGLVPPMPYGDM